MIATIRDFHAQGTCVFCGLEKENLQDVEFADGSFVGLLCFTDYKKALRMFNAKRQSKPVAASENGRRPVSST